MNLKRFVVTATAVILLVSCGSLCGPSRGVAHAVPVAVSDEKSSSGAPVTTETSVTNASNQDDNNKANEGTESIPANRLARESSPYLLMHAHNPVDWYPWGPEAFEKARTENKPVFLSVGYSSCY